MGFLAPVIGAIGSFFGGLGIVGKLVLGIGLQLISAKLQKNRAKKAEQQAGGVQFELQYGENVSRQVACGLVGMAGHDCYANSYGDANKLLQQVYAFSDFPCDGLSRIWAGGKELPLTHQGGGHYTVDSGDYAGLLSFRFYDGTQTAADATLISGSNPFGRWTANHVGTGICYIVAYLTYDQERLAQPPQFFFEIRGARLYDVRKDSTAGGVGPHRWGNYSTYEWTENPVIMDYNYRRGFAVNGDMFLGMGMSPVDLPVDRYAIAANICDENASYGKRCRCSVIFDADLEHGDNIDAVMQSCGGIVVDSVDGSWPLIGTDQPIVETITDADLISTEPVRFQKFKSQADIVNSVQGTYPEPANMWSPVGYDTQTNSSQVGLDRRTRDFKLDFPTVPYKAQANQLAAIYYKENRYEATAEIVVRPRFQTIKAGDWIRWNSARYGDRVYMVASRSIKALTSGGPRNVVLSLVERDGSIYDSVGVLPPVIPFPPGEPVYVNELPDYAVIPVKAIGADGRSYAAFRISWSTISDPTVTAIEFQWRIKTEPTNIFNRTVPADALIAFIQEGIVSLTEYEFRYRVIVSGRVQPGWTNWGEYTSIDGGNADIEVGLANLNKDVLDRFSEIQKDNQDAINLILDALTSFSLDGAVGQIQRDKMRAETGQAFAEILEEKRVRVTAYEALAQIIQLLQTDYDGNKATVASQITALSNADTAMATTIDSLNVAVGDVSAQGLAKFSLAANQSGVDARYSISIRGAIGQTYKETGLFLELYTVSGVQRTRLAILADQFVVTDGTATTLPMVFEGGELKLQIANIGLVRSGRLLSQNNKVDFDLNAGRLTFRS